MSQWEGSELKHNIATKQPRKPKGAGVELKCSADANTGIKLRLEIQEGEEKNKEKKYQAQPHNLPFHVAITLRLIEPWLNTFRIIVADSASLITAIELLKRNVYFVGIVKSACKYFPKQYFKNWSREKPKMGDYKVCLSEFPVTHIANSEGFQITKTHNLRAVAWQSKKMKSIISSFGVTTLGEPQIVPRCRVIVNIEGTLENQYYLRETPCPKIANEIFSAFKIIDVHYHYRQGILKLEQSWKSQSWWQRLFSTLLSVIATDAYFMYRHEFSLYNVSEFEQLSYEMFIAKLANQLIFDYGESSKHISRNSRRKETTNIDEVNEIL